MYTYIHAQLLASIQVFNSVGVTSVAARRGRIAAGADDGRIKQIRLSFRKKNRDPVDYEELRRDAEDKTDMDGDGESVGEIRHLKQVDLSIVA